MRLQDFICCPGCRAGLEEHAGEGGVGPGLGPRSHHRCAACGGEYPVIDGLVDFLPDVERRTSLAQRLMESERIASIYESRWWRGSRSFSRLAGIRLEEEISLIGKILEIRAGDGVLDLACGPGLYARRFAAELAESGSPVVIFSIADCLRDFLPEEFEVFYGDGHLTCFRRAGAGTRSGSGGGSRAR